MRVAGRGVVLKVCVAAAVVVVVGDEDFVAFLVDVAAVDNDDEYVVFGVVAVLAIASSPHFG